MSADDGLLELIEENIHNLVEVQKKANKAYNDLSMEDYTENYNKLAIALYDEQTLLKAITHNLNAYFEILIYLKYYFFVLILLSENLSLI